MKKIYCNWLGLQWDSLNVSFLWHLFCNHQAHSHRESVVFNTNDNKIIIRIVWMLSWVPHQGHPLNPSKITIGHPLRHQHVERFEGIPQLYLYRSTSDLWISFSVLWNSISDKCKSNSVLWNWISYYWNSISVIYNSISDKWY